METSLQKKYKQIIGVKNYDNTKAVKQCVHFILFYFSIKISFIEGVCITSL